MASLGDRLKERKIVQWALGYLAGAFVVTQLLDVLETPLGLSVAVQRVVLVLLVTGFAVTLVLAWYHGEKGRQRLSAPEVFALLAVLMAGTAGSVLVWKIEPAAVSGSPQRTAFLPPDDRPGIAVLPLASRSPEVEDRYFTDGIHDELLTRLSQIQGIRVVSRTSVERYRESQLSSADIATELRVQYLLEGGVQRAGNRVRLNVQLIDGATDEHLWAEIYDVQSTAEELLDIQSSITAAVAAELRVVVTDGERRRLAARATRDRVAYDAYLSALAARYDNSLDLVDRHSRAIELLTSAVASDPDFGLAYYRMGASHSIIYGNGWDRSTDRAAQARQAIERGKSLAPDALEGPLWEAQYRYHVAREYGRVLTLLDQVDQNFVSNAEAALVRAFTYRRMGAWDEAVEALRFAAAIEPGREPHELGNTLHWMGRYADAEEVLRANVERYPDAAALRVILSRVVFDRTGDVAAAMAISANWDLVYRARDWDRAEERLRGLPDDHVFFGAVQYQPIALRRALILVGRGDTASARPLLAESVRVLERAGVAHGHDGRIFLSLALSHALLGSAEEARAAVRRALELTPVEADRRDGVIFLMSAAAAHAIIGDRQEALDLLGRYFSMPHQCSARCVEQDPLFDGLRDDADFRTLLSRVSATRG